MLLTIRAAQMESFRVQRRREFAPKLARLLRGYWPDRYLALGPRDFEALVLRALEQGASYGFETERQLGMFVNVVFALGEGFDEDPRQVWALRILRSTRPAGRKIERLCSETSRRLRAGDPR